MANVLAPSRSASAALKAAAKFVSEFGPWFGLGRMCCKVAAIMAKHGETFFAEAEAFCDSERRAQASSAAPSDETPVSAAEAA